MTDGEDEGDIAICPECDSPDIYARVGNMQMRPRQGDPTDRYRCLDCGATFGRPDHREHKHVATLHGLTAVLADADDLDEVAAALGGEPDE